MTKRYLLFAGLLIALILAGCGSEETPVTEVPSPTARPPTIVVPTATERPEVTPSPTLAPFGKIERLLDAELGTIRIVAQGEYEPLPEGVQTIPHGSGSGFIIHPSGIALTTYNVVAGGQGIKVWIGDDMARVYDASIIGLSECDNLALIKIEGDGFNYFEWSQDELQDGYAAYVAGVPNNETGFVILKGNIISTQESGDTALSSVDHVIHYDTAVEPGHSGGAVLNAEGRVIGIHQSLCGEEETPCGTPAEIAQAGVEALMRSDEVENLGVNGQAMILDLPAYSGIYVASVHPESPYAFAGVKAGDLLTELDGQALAEDGSMASYCNLTRSLTGTETVDLQLVRLRTGEVFEGNLNLDQLALKTTLTVAEGGVQLNLEGLDINASEPGEVYFETDFKDGLDYWDSFILNGDPEDVDISTATGVFSITIDGPQVYAYYIFNPNNLMQVADVVLETTAENQAATTNNVSLVCRYKENIGWYEFNVTSGGLYFINRFDGITGEYVQLARGGSFDINMGQRTNEITARCISDQLTLIVNGEQLRTVQDDILKEGMVGLSVSSFGNYPVVIEISEFRASVPESE